ncbi:MAG: hypothetical protein ABIJ09_00165 [Pseudomonadota bacterium]
MHHSDSCDCDHLKLEVTGQGEVDDCPTCGAVTWLGEEKPEQVAGDALTCANCGTRVIAWIGENKVSTLRRCLSCDDVVVLQT